MSADITEKKPKKAATKKTTSVGEIPSAAVKAIRAKSTPKATAENAGDEVRPSEQNVRRVTRKYRLLPIAFSSSAVGSMALIRRIGFGLSKS
jgi:hypothetical protein